MNKIYVPKPVYEGLEAVRQSGAVNMFDYVRHEGISNHVLRTHPL